MKNLFLYGLLVTLGHNVKAQCEKEPFILFEMFTSQGCNFCPPWIDHFKDIGFNFQGANILMIAHHTQQFDGVLPSPCGGFSSWVDLYGSNVAEIDHRKYNTIFGRTAYGVPQMIVQGQDATSFNLPQTVNAIEEKITFYKTEIPEVGVCLELVSFNEAENTVKFNYDIIDSKNDGTEELVYVLLEDELYGNEITSGENCGATLNHDRVRREFKTYSISSAERASGTLVMSYSSDVVDENILVGAYVRKKDTRVCIGGTKGFKHPQYASISKASEPLKSATLYPNPSNGFVTIASQATIDVIKIHDLAGRELISINEIAANEFSFDLKQYGLAEGVYTYQVIFENKQNPSLGKIVLQ